MNALIVGASSQLGQCIAEKLAERYYNLFLVSSDEQDLYAISQDLMLRFGITVKYAAINLKDFNICELRTSVINSFGRISHLFYIAGVGYLSKDSGFVSDEMLEELVHVNFVSSLKIINSFLSQLEDQSKANIIGISSVATTRPRRINSIYASSKRGMEFYFDALRHYLADKQCKVQCYRLGYMESRLSSNKKFLLPLSQPKSIAKKIIKNLGRDKSKEYLPRWWLLIMSIYKILPWNIYKRLSY